MKKSILVLWGASQQGKSTVLKKIIKHYKPEIELSSGIDYCLVVNINGKVVGISTSGDDSNVYIHLNELKQQGCDFFITASEFSPFNFT